MAQTKERKKEKAEREIMEKERAGDISPPIGPSWGEGELGRDIPGLLFSA